MGSLFSSPSVPTVSPVAYVPSSQSQTNVAKTVSTQTSSSTSQPDDTEDAVRDIIRKSSRGRSSTIQTSFRGVLDETSSLAPKRKTLLGE